MPEHLQILPLNSLPEDALAEIVDASWHHWQSLGYSDDPALQNWREHLREEDPQTPRLNYVVTCNGHVAAMASIAETDFPSIPEYTPWLINLFVLPAYRGKGLSAMLRDHRLEVLKQLGYTSVYILPAPGTIGLHQAAGFVMLNPELNVMRKAL